MDNKIMQVLSPENKRAITVIGFAIGLLCTSYTLVELSNKKKRVRSSREIPAPKSGYPVVGHMFSLGDLPSTTVHAWHQELGPIIQLNMGVQTWIMVADPVLAHKIMVVNGTKSAFRPYSHFSYYIHGKEGKGIGFAQPNEVLKRTRSEVQAVLAPKQIETYMDNINRESHELIDQLLEETTKEGGVYPFELLKWFTMNTIMLVCFGKRFETAEHPEFQTFSEIVEITIKNLATESDLANFLPSLSFLDYFSGTRSKYTKYFKTIRDPLYLKTVYDAIHADVPNLIKSIKENGANWTDDEYIAFLSDILVAGTDTVAVSLLWNMNLMCHYPDCQKTASDEVDNFIRNHGRLPRFSERTEVPYIVCVMKECLRFKPTTQFGLPHAVVEDLEVDGYIIPKGASIRGSMHSLHRSSKYDNPNLFFPERYMNNLKTMHSLQNSGPEERDQFNFGWGRRSCPGSYLAEAEMFSAFVRILAGCTVEPPSEGMPGMDEAVNAGLHFLPVPCKLRFIKRKNSPLYVI
ncbi:hypothetical protein INT47_003149 [Mucor saturninus]|uniref:Cytochrome P450 n=1 Tax=Mucor saturninus TaxID=64648 RepID=A0A8H7QY26_9FUNG|nr:hypothetical protein INT47_003149 [Mucor saturninus]